MSLKGKTALVTGSTSGIGLAIARALGKAGANVMLNGFGEAAAIEEERTAIEKAFGIKAAYSGADMSKPAEIAALVKETQQTFGALDILVNNAGIQHVAKIEDFPADKWDAVIAINLSSSFHAIKAAIPGMKARKWGRIINIASAHGLVASGEKVAYVAAKHGLVGMTKVVAIEAANDGVTCNAICPGWVLTPLVQKQVDARAKASGQSDEQAKVALRLREAADAPVQLAGQYRCARRVPRLRRRRDHHGIGLLDRRRLDRAVNFFARTFGREENPQPSGPKRINLALQGGGAHGAFTWGVLDHLLEDGRLAIDGISGTSAGAINAVMLADGLARGRTRRSAQAAFGFLARRRASAATCCRCSAPSSRSCFPCCRSPARRACSRPGRASFRPTTSIRSTSIRSRI